MNGTDNITQQNKKSITMPNQSQPTKQEIISVFKELGFSDSQIEKMITARNERTDTAIPFQRIDIRKRYEEYRQIFAPHGVSKSHLNEILSTEIMFSFDPRQYKQLFHYIERTGMPVADFLKITTTSGGRSVLARSPQMIIRNTQAMAQLLSPFGIDEKEWLKMSLKRPSILKQTPTHLMHNLKQMGDFVKQFDCPAKEWFCTALKHPVMLDRNVETLKRKHEKMCLFLTEYGVTPKEWTQACLKSPQLLYLDSAYIQKRFQFFMQAYQNGEFIFTTQKEQNASHLIRTLLNSPQYLCYSDDNLKLRQDYMDYMNRTNRQATSAVLYLTKAKLKQIMQK